MGKFTYNRIVENSSDMTDHRQFVTPVRRPMIPTGDDYKMGKFSRYFCISEIDERVVEIDILQHSTIPHPKKGISPHLWKPIQMKWKLKGPRFDVLKNGICQAKGVTNVNKATVSGIAKRNPKIASAISDYTLFANIDADIQVNLYTNEGLLVYKDDINKDFSGLYHIHSVKGPMEGPYHTNKPHAQLRYKAEVEEMFEEVTTIKELPQSTDEPSVDAPSGDSGGGGGY